MEFSSYKWENFEEQVTSNLGSHVAQLVGCWTYNPRVVGSIPIDANCFMWITSLGKMLTWSVPLSTQGKYGYPALRDTGFCALHGSNR